MLVLGGIEAGLEQAVARCQQSIDSGEALERLIKVVEMQGGDPRAIEDTSRLPLGTSVRELKAPRSGWIVDIDAMTTGRACVLLGAGRLASTDAVDHGAGVVLAAKPGVEVAKGDLLATMYASEAGRLGPASEVLSTAFAIGSERPELRASRIIEVI
jgi:pyrimidine-nucleoside phosphorylase